MQGLKDLRFFKIFEIFIKKIKQYKISKALKNSTESREILCYASLITHAGLTPQLLLALASVGVPVSPINFAE